LLAKSETRGRDARRDKSGVRFHEPDPAFSVIVYGERTMCLGVPMRIVEIDGFKARCEARGIERQASLFLLQHENVQVGDMVMIHVGNAIQKMSEEEALSAWEIYDEMLALEDEANRSA